MDFDEDGEHIRRALGWARLAAVPLLLTGLMYAATVAQIVLFAARQGPLVLTAELGFGLLSAAHVALGYRVYDASYAATLAAAVSAFGGALFALIWGTLLILQGTVSFLVILVCLGGVASGIACVRMVPLTAASDAARRRLLEG